MRDARSLEREIEGSASLITAKLGRRPFTFVFPYNHHNGRLDSLVDRHPAIIREHEAEFGNVLYSLQAMNAAIDTAVQQGSWLAPTLHGFRAGEYAPVASDVFAQHLRYVQSRARDIWVESYGTVGCYVRERQTATLAVQSGAEQHLTFTVTCPLDAATFHVPLTIVIPTGLSRLHHVTVTHGRQATALPVTVQPNGDILLDVVPGNESVHVWWK